MDRVRPCTLGMGQEERCHHGFSYPSTPARVWTQRTILAKLAEDLTRFLTKTQRSLTSETLHLSSRKRETLVSLLVECAEGLSYDIGIWRSLEAYNRDFFGTPLPCVLPPDETMDAEPLNPERMQFLLWTLYAELEPGLILAPKVFQIC